MKYDGFDNVGDFHGGNGRIMEESRTTSTAKGMADSYYALSLFDQTTNSSVAMSILPLRLCGLCLYMPLLLHGTCPCLVSCICAGDTPIEQLGTPDIQRNRRRANGYKNKKKQ